MLRAAACFIFCLCFLALAGQPYRVFVYEPPALHEGVSRSLMQTPDGFLWFGSFSALVAYDGSTYHYFRYDPNDSTSVTHGSFYQVVYDPRGYIWAGSDMGGLSKLDLRTGKSANFFSDPGNPNSIAGDRVSGLTLDRAGNVWVATDNFALSRIDTTGRITRFQPPLPEGVRDYVEAGSLREIIEDARQPDMLWVNANHGLYRFFSSSGSFEFIEPVLDDGPVKQSFHDIVQDHSGRLWLGTGRQGIWRFDPARGKWKQFKAIVGDGEHTTTNSIMELICTQDGRIIGSTHVDGLWTINPETDSLSLYMPEDEDLQFHFLANEPLLEDKYGDIWTGYKKLMRLTDRQPAFRFYPFWPQLQTQIKGNWQREYMDDPLTGNFFIATTVGDGLLEANIRTGKVIAHRYKAKEGPDVYDVQMEAIELAGDSGVWIGSTDGLLYYNRTTQQVRKVTVADTQLADLMDEFVTALLVDSRDDLLFATSRKGLIRWTPTTGKWKQLLEPVPANSGELLEVEQSPEGDYWLVFDRDVFVLDGKTEESTFLPHRKGSKPGLSMDWIKDVTFDHVGNAWISTDGGGINVVTANEDGSYDFSYYTSADGLPSENVYELVVADDQRIWAGTRNGIAVIDPSTGLIVSFRSSDGLSFPSRTGALYQLATGEILSGGRAGFHFTHPDSIRLRTVVPRPYLYEVETADEQRLLPFVSEAHIRITPPSNHFTVTWGAISFDETPKTRFAYMLEGFDDDWILAGDRTYARYSKLPGGNYQFKLKAVNDRGEWSEELSMLQVQVIPPFTSTIWFFVLIGLGVLSILYLIYWLRVRNIRKEAQLKGQFEHELAQVEMQALRAQMNPHFLFNSLNSINRFIVKNDPKSAAKYLTRFSRLIRLILDNSKRNKVSLSSELEAIRLYVELESLRFDNKFSFQMQVAENVEPENIEIDSMILQPYIENAIWHGLMHKDGHGNLKLDISRNHTSLTCVIEDDGIGREKAGELKSRSAVKDKSYGMKITSDRLRMLSMEQKTGASVEVTDLVGPEGTSRGTKVKITLPC